MPRTNRSFITKQGQITTKYFRFQRACGPNYHQVLVSGFIKRRKFIPTRPHSVYQFETAEFADLFYKVAPIYEPSKNLKDYGTEGEEAWYHFDSIYHSLRQQEVTKIAGGV
jgi:hypothetical protein